MTDDGAQPPAGAMNTLPLRDIRVLDFTHGLAGPFGTQMLAYFGAQVIKVESAARPDRFRQAGNGASPPAFNRGFAEFNRNKLDISVNMGTNEGRRIARNLIAISDLIAENFSAGVLRRWGLTYDQLKDVHPEIIVVSLPGMGSRGPNRHWVTWGASLLAFSGVTWMWGYPDQEEPVGNQIAHPDYVGGILGAIGAMAALDERRRTGLGQAVELPQVAGAVSLLPTTFLEYFANARPPQRAGNSSPWYAPYGVYPCAGSSQRSHPHPDPLPQGRGEEKPDRWCVIAVTSEAEWTAFCRAIGEPSWTKDGRFTSMAGRVAHRDHLDRHVTAWTRQFTPHEVMDRLQGAGVSAGAVQNGRDLFHDPHLRARNMVLQGQHAKLPELAFPGIPVKLSETPGVITRPAPELGQDNDHVFGELLGMASEDVAGLRESGVLA